MSEYLIVVVLLIFLLIASLTDVTRHKIYNWNTYPGIAFGLALNLVDGDWPGMQESLIGVFACGFVMLVCFVLFNVGGGDVKLIAMMGAFLGLEMGIEAMLWTFVIGGIMGTSILIWQFGLLRILTKSYRHLLLVFRARSWIPLNEEEREPLRRWLFLAPSAMVAVCIVSAQRVL